MPQILRIRVLDWNHFYLNHPGGSRHAKKPEGYVIGNTLSRKWSCSLRRARYVNSLKNRKNIFGHLPPKNMAEPKPWYAMHVDLIGTYRKSIRQQQPGGAIIWKNASMTCMTMIDPATGWFKIFEMPTFNLDEVTASNNE